MIWNTFKREGLGKRRCVVGAAWNLTAEKLLGDLGETSFTVVMEKENRLVWLKRNGC